MVALAVAGVAALPEIVRRVVVWRLAASTGRSASLASLELSLLGGRLDLRDLRVMDRDGGPLATIEGLEVRFRPGDLVRGHLRITAASLRAPVVRIVRTGPSEFNVSDLLGRGAGGGGPAPDVTVDHFELRGGAVTIEDRTLAPPRTWRVDGITLDARSVSTRPEVPPGTVTLAAVAAGSHVSLWVAGVRLAPLAFQAAAIARGIDGSLAALYLPPGSPLTPSRATLDVSATIAHGPATGTRLSLDAVFGGVELRGAGQAGTLVLAPAVRVTVEDLALRAGAVTLGRLAIDGGRLVLEDTRLAPIRRWQADGVAFEARGLSSERDAPAGIGSFRAVVAGSPLTVWIANIRLAPLELHATAIVRDVDFALFRIYVPRGLPVQPERGVVNASVTLDHDASRGTRMALDVGLRDVELRRPAHFVTAPSLRVAAEDITFGAGAVAIGRVALTGARLTLEDRTFHPPRTWPVQGLAVEASRLSSRREDVQGIATARASVAGAAVSAFVTHVRIEPLELRATAILRDLDLALVQLYLPADVPVQLDRGVVNASVDVAHAVATGSRLTGDVTITGVQARGRGATARLTVAAPSLRLAVADARWRQDGLDVGRLELTTRGSLVDGSAGPTRFDLERLRVASEQVTWPITGPAHVGLSARFRDGGEVDVDGTALLTAPPPMIAFTSELTVRLARLDVGPVGAYVPAARGLGGRVSARLTASAAYGASLTARVQGDLDADRLALADGDQTLLSLRRFEATGLDVLWPQRVGAGRIRLLRPRALIQIGRGGTVSLLARFAPPAAPPGPAPAEAAPSDQPPAPSSGASSPAPAPGPAAGARPRLPAIAFGEVGIEQGGMTLVDERTTSPARFEVPRLDATLQDVQWPGSTPARIRLDAALPSRGTLDVAGTVLAEPATVDLKLSVADADLSLIQPYLPFRAGVRAHLDTTLAVSGPLVPAPRVAARGDVTLRDLALVDGSRSVLTVERLGATGIEAAWPERLTIDRLRVRRSWAMVERDEQGRFLLRSLLERTPGASPPSNAPAPGGPALAFRLVDGLFEDGAVTIVDGVTTPPARFEIAGVRLAVNDLTVPSRGPARIELASPTPGGGRLEIGGSMNPDPVRLEVRAALNDVEIAPAQPYLPIEGRVAGRVTGDLAVAIALDPLSVKVSGQTRLRRFRLSDGDRPVMTVGRAEALGIDVDWPARIGLTRLRFRRPSLLIERDADGRLTLSRLVAPRWKAASPAENGSAKGSSPRSAPPTIEIGTLGLEKASARFVDQTTTPPYVEQLSDFDVTFTGVTTAPGRQTRFTGGGELSGGSTFTFKGEGAPEPRPTLQLTFDLRDFPLPRANPYLEKFTAWTATHGTMTATANYELAGTQVDARHEITLRGLQVVHTDASDEVEKRLGLPLGFLVSLLKNARGEIHLSLPVSADLSAREFDFQEAVWSSVRAVAIRLLALPFSRIGSLFFSEGSKVEAVTLGPVVFEAGTAHLAPGMDAHLDRIAVFLRETPSVTLRLAPIAIQADLDALRRERAPAASGAELPPEALRELGARRLGVVRQELVGRGGVDAGRLTGSARRAALVEAAGVPRVELDLRP